MSRCKELNCERCFHFSFCENDVCPGFVDKDSVIILPCKKGDILHRNGIVYKVDHWNILATAFDIDGNVALFDVKDMQNRGDNE